jgi:hypothetical protein
MAVVGGVSMCAEEPGVKKWDSEADRWSIG